MNTVLIDELDPEQAQLVQQAVSIVVESFGDAWRYDAGRVRSEFRPMPAPFYRKFFVARDGDTVLGVAGVKAADWAADTHVLYLSAVATEARGQGIGKALVRTRLNWITRNFSHGRVVVSTAKTQRFRTLGFKPVSEGGDGEKHLMLLEF